MEKKYLISEHALLRIHQRGSEYGLHDEETTQRVFETIKGAKVSTTKHRSKRHITYYTYYSDNLTMYVVCQVERYECIIRTIIIEDGRP